MKLLKAIFIFVFSTWLAGIPIADAQVVINEVCASNSDLISDIDGNFSDWIEIVNTGSESINLEGHAFSDDRRSTSPWLFPEYLMNPGEYLVVFASGKDISTPPTNWKTLVNPGDIWRYHLPSSNISGWRDAGFDDGSWHQGPGGVGYSDGDDATTISSTIAVYMRIRFTIADISKIEAAVLHMDYDDGFVAYINGIEVGRANLNGIPPDYNTFTTVDREALMYTGGKPERYDIDNPASVFQNGENVLAVEVHNVSETSSDLSSIPFLSVLSQAESGSPPPDILELSANTFHTNFRLDADGDSLYLSDPTGSIIDSFFVSWQFPNHSFGRQPGNYMDWYLFEIPTPGAENSTVPYLGYSRNNLHFSREGGRFTNPFQLVLTPDNPGDPIYYSTDGSEPGTGSILYNSPITINGNTVIRASIIKENYLPGRPVTHTYITGLHAGLPVVSVSTDPYNLWDYYYGIYVEGPNAQPDNPHFGANYWQDWERPAHIEMVDDKDSLAFSIDAGIKIYGAWTRAHPQKSLSVFARAEYGDRKVAYKLFEDKPIDEFEAFILRNSGNDWFGQYNESGSMFRDAFMTTLTRDMAIERQAIRQAVVYINGEYWGIHNIREKINEHFIASNAGIDPDRVELMENNQQVIQGSGQHYAELIDFVSINNLAYEGNYNHVKQQIDIRNFINYEVAQIFFDNRDWPGNNIKYWRPDYDNGRWRWIIYDTDFGFGLWDRNKVSYNTLQFALEPYNTEWPNPSWATLLLRKLVTNETFKNLFINTFADRINTVFKSSETSWLIDEFRLNIFDEMQNHAERWGGYHQNWVNRINDMEYFGNQRPGIMRNHIQTTFGLGGIHFLTLNMSNKEAGIIRLNSLLLDEFPWTGLYFEDVPVEVTAVSSPGYIFTGWSGDINSTESHISIDMNAAKSLTANFQADPDPSPAGIIINEVCFSPDSLNSTEDWIELYNTGDQYVDLSGWLIKDGDDSHIYSILKGTILEPHGYHVLCRNRYKFRAIHSEVDDHEGNLGFGFSSLGDVVRLFNSDNELVNLVSYGVNTPWPVIRPGSGFTLSLLSPDLDNFMASSWSVSDEKYGTPGRKNFDDPVNTIPENSKELAPLLQCFPNPFHHSTRIMFHTVGFQPVRLSVFDMKGSVLEILLDGNLESGDHELVWTPAISGGVYILRLETPELVQTLRMVKVN
ncbi:MAG: CotH kinase family protein [Bacteroidales bacterium]|nr:CotH kinase family protein [Bacteroidales bacterium]MBN2698905.1 CotH kinase family protein [Bacteroidales bacterium]